jgi:hypothetical protein
MPGLRFVASDLSALQGFAGLKSPRGVTPGEGSIPSPGSNFSRLSNVTVPAHDVDRNNLPRFCRIRLGGDSFCGTAEIVFVDNVVAFEDLAGLVAEDSHNNALILGCVQLQRRLVPRHRSSNRHNPSSAAIPRAEKTSLSFGLRQSSGYFRSSTPPAG